MTMKSIGCRAILMCVLFVAPLGVKAADEVADLVNRVKPAVVTILAYETKESPLPFAIGTGFFISADRIVTNWHVIDGAKKLEFRDSNANSYPIVSVIGKDTEQDLAILAPEDKYKPKAIFQIHDSEVKVGTKVYVLGSPLGLDCTLSDGLVSSRRKFDSRQVIQITAPISPGSSGSPVFGSDGRVFGVATFTVTKGQSLNFAIPITHVSQLMNGKPTPVDQVTDPKTDKKPRIDRTDEFEESLYGYFANKYLEAIDDQHVNHPNLKFGMTDGSVGHLNGTAHAKGNHFEELMRK